MKYEKYNKGKNDLFSGIVLGGKGSGQCTGKKDRIGCGQGLLG